MNASETFSSLNFANIVNRIVNVAKEARGVTYGLK